MKTLHYQLQKLIFLLKDDITSEEIKTLINSITSKIQSFNHDSEAQVIEEEINDYDFCDDILH